MLLLQGHQRQALWACRQQQQQKSIPASAPPPLPLLLQCRQRHQRRQRRQRAVAASVAAAAGDGRVVWVQTSNKDVATASVESGLLAGSPLSALLFTPETARLAAAWRKLCRFDAVRYNPSSGEVTAMAVEAADADESSGGGGGGGEQGGVKAASASSSPVAAADAAAAAVVGRVWRVGGRGDLDAAAAAAARDAGVTVMDASDWRVIPAENLVAARAGNAAGGRLLGVAASCADAQVLLEALEGGTDGVLLRTDDPREARALAAYLRRRGAEGAPAFALEEARVTRVAPVGMCDRVCVDLASLMVPGEGLLVGSFARAMLLVHSECAASEYINSRPFRVNAGAVHAYCQAPDGRTAYLCELRAGDEVAVVDAAGRARTAVVGRAKVEARPMLLVEAAAAADGEVASLILQNAETVRLVGPAAGGNGGGGGDGGSSWVARSVSELRVGDRVLMARAAAARHTGIAVDEFVAER